MINLKVLDLFCGCGGLSYGFHLAGFIIKYGLDIWKTALEIFKKNHPQSQPVLQDITKLSDKEILTQFKDIDIIIGGPPCQAFSSHGKRNLDDPRALLVKEYLRCVKILRPICFLFENVGGFVNFNQGKLKEELIEQFINLGYNLDYKIIKASDYGLPQRRPRFFILGFRQDLNIYPRLPEKYLLFNKNFVLKDIFEDLPEPYESMNEKPKDYLFEPNNELLKFLRQNSKFVPYYHRVKTNYNWIEKIYHLILPNKVLHDCIDKNLIKEYNIPKEFGRAFYKLNPDKVSLTIATQTYYFHYKYPRLLTLLEISRIQTFPDNYFNPELSNHTLNKIIGNAVPPLLGLSLANIIKENLENKEFNRKEVK